MRFRFLSSASFSWLAESSSAEDDSSSLFNPGVKVAEVVGDGIPGLAPHHHGVHLGVDSLLLRWRVISLGDLGKVFQVSRQAPGKVSLPADSPGCTGGGNDGRGGHILVDQHDNSILILSIVDRMNVR